MPRKSNFTKREKRVSGDSRMNFINRPNEEVRGGEWSLLWRRHSPTAVGAACSDFGIIRRDPGKFRIEELFIADFDLHAGRSNAWRGCRANVFERNRKDRLSFERSWERFTTGIDNCIALERERSCRKHLFQCCKLVDKFQDLLRDRL